MNTLSYDLVNLISCHLTTTEDNFINLNVDELAKNLKIAVRTKNWKSVLYYLQRYGYQKSIIKNAYYGACQLGELNMMKLFATQEIDFRSLKYLAKGLHYHLIEHELKRIDKHIENKLANFEYLILEGLIISDDTDSIRSLISTNKLSNSSPRMLGLIFYKAAKHNRQEILEYLINKTDPEHIPFHHIMMGRIKRKDSTVINHNFDDCAYGYKNGIICGLARYGYHNIALKLLFSEVCDYNLLSKYIDGLLLGCWYDELAKVIPLLKEKFESLADYVAMSAIRIDNLDLFIKYYDAIYNEYETLVGNAIMYQSFKILKYLFEIDKSNVQRIYSYIKDPRIAKMIVREIKNGRKIGDMDRIKTISSRDGDNIVVFKILSEVC